MVWAFLIEKQKYLEAGKFLCLVAEGGMQKEKSKGIRRIWYAIAGLKIEGDK